MTLITEPTQLVEACRRLANETFLSIDTEFMREKTYYPQLCLIQIAGKKEAIVIDALAEDINLNPVLELMENEAITKVFHACRQDIEIFYNLNHKIPSPIFDTQIGAMVCGYGESVGYDKLVRQITGIQIDKSSRFTDWSYRPLSKQQIKYALSDVTHLRTVFEALSSQLEKSGRTKWLEEEFKTVLNPETYNTPLDKSWKRLKVKNGQPRFLILIRELCAFREREAQNRNVPRNRIIRDDILLDIAARSPKSPHDLAKVRNLTKQFSQGKLGESILRVVETANKIPDSEAPPLEKVNNFQHQKSALVDLLKVLLKLKSEDFNVAQKLIANSTDLEAIANNNDANVLALTGWRKDIFGDDALLLKTGKIALSASNGKIQLIRL
ncbi:MAG: ribonuclease D [Rhodospirillaceae bacterium]|jgi:ribonuclease D|nr:ribonuclease D [Rhodospirillaceae bacterium]MBT5912214.1 ribonuclease D [Rhodospirillaceae bacterium]MBT6307329.1 ribonuclease D [Rhodospirillaceae bacterium]MDC0998223.1 ribonuclease D [Alphaproteobacteria bacterium]MDC1442068.1 ribonuclease D [Rhodospirillaceae bacterium]